MIVLVAGLLLALLPFLMIMSPIIIWAVWPSITLVAAVLVARTIQRRRHALALLHQP